MLKWFKSLLYKKSFGILACAYAISLNFITSIKKMDDMSLIIKVNLSTYFYLKKSNFFFLEMRFYYHVSLLVFHIEIGGSISSLKDFSFRGNLDLK